MADSNIKVYDMWGDGFLPIPLAAFTFSGGERQVRLAQVNARSRKVLIVAHVSSAMDLMDLFLATDAVRRELENPRIDVVMPYLPYARQDRVCAPGEALSLKVVCDLINAQRYDSITIWDSHSDVGPALLNNVTNIHCYEFVKDVVAIPVERHLAGLPLHPRDAHLAGTILIAPDAGAAKKVQKCADKLKLRMITATKVRNPETGAITQTHIDEEAWDRVVQPNGPDGLAFRSREIDDDFLIVDDICDGGRTFIELAKALRAKGAKNIRLYVTHGIFSQGFSPLLEVIDTIHVANSFYPINDRSRFQLTTVKQILNERTRNIL